MTALMLWLMALGGSLFGCFLDDRGSADAPSYADSSAQRTATTPRRSHGLFVYSFSPQRANGIHQRLAHQRHPKPIPPLDRLKSSVADDDVEDGQTGSLATSSTEGVEIDVSNINEAQMLLACRAYLMRKHKLEWKQKKRRAEAAASPLNNEGYFWPDPNDLLYLREDPDPHNLIYNETYGEYYGYKRNGVRFLASQDTTYSGKNYFEDESVQPEFERASESTSPFSANPLYPSDEHVKRSKSKQKLWNNETWKEEWYERRWAGRVATKEQQIREKQDKVLREIPNDVIESHSFDDMSEDEVVEAIITFLNANQRKSESRKGNKFKRQIERESFRKWREGVKEEANNQMTGQNITKRGNDIVQKVTPPSEDETLSFSPSVETMAMKRLKVKRSEKSRKAYQARLASDTSSPKKKKITKLRATYNRGDEIEEYMMRIDSYDRDGEISPMQAILRINNALDDNELPSPTDVETILKPRRLGRRDILRRILRERFDLRGKCVPSLTGDEHLFVTTCTIHELGAFVLAKLREKTGSTN